MVVGGLGVPFINAGDFARSIPDNIYGAAAETSKREVFQIYDTGEYNTFQAAVQVLDYFNWTLVGNLFIANSYGYNRQRLIQEYSNEHATPILHVIY